MFVGRISKMAFFFFYEFKQLGLEICFNLCLTVEFFLFLDTFSNEGILNRRMCSFFFFFFNELDLEIFSFGRV